MGEEPGAHGSAQRLPRSRLGDPRQEVELRIPKLCRAATSPTAWSRAGWPRRRSPQLMQEAYVHGVSTCSVDDLIKALGMSVISKSQVSRLCAEIDERVNRLHILVQDEASPDQAAEA